jgi:transcriptional regulator with XRE-family HTH domain
MGQNLATKIKHLAEENKLSVLALEKKSGLKTGAVRNILTGHSKKPSAEILLAISKVLGCSIGELLDEDSEKKPENKLRQKMFIAHIELLRQVVNYSIDFYLKHKIDLTNVDFFDEIMQIYLYSVRDDRNEFDEKFADWLLEKKLYK